MNRPVVIALGVSHRDVELASLWLRWVGFLAQHAPQGNVIVVHTKRVDPAPLIEAGMQIPSLSIHQCPDEDESGYPKSASHLFLRTLEKAEKEYPGHAILWCEPDTVPMRPSWFREISEEYDRCGKPNMGALIGTQYPHQSGNSIYAHDWRTRFPSIANVLSAPDYKLWGPGKGQPWDVWCRKETTPQMAESKLWHHVWKDRDARATRLRDIPATACIFHQDKAGHLIREIAAARHPEFMATISVPRRFYFMNGHPNRLRAKGLMVKFSFTQWTVGGHRSAVCSDELGEAEASALATLVGQLGIREMTEAEFMKLTGRTAKSLPEPRVRLAPVRAAGITHPNVFVMLGRYGDICNVLPLLKAEADAGRRPTLVVGKDFADILDGVSYCDRIVWDGAYEQLPEALRWLRRDKGIMAPVVCQVHRNPYDRARFTDSYMKEVWRLAGRLEKFEARGPLVFDRRDSGREFRLLDRTLYGKHTGTVLVGLGSISSPLENAPAIMEAVRHRFGETHHVIDLAGIRAERVYDLIGLFDAASLVISADTMYLHLARASKVPLLAIVNNGWRGSVVEHAKTVIRYADAEPFRVAAEATAIIVPLAPNLAGLTPETFATMGAVEADMAVTVIPDKIELAGVVIGGGCTWKERTPKLFHAVDIFGIGERFTKAQSTWEAAYAEGMEPIHVSAYPRDAATELGDPRKLPFLKDVLWAAIPPDATKCGGNIVVWTNSDTGFAPGTVGLIRDHVSKHGTAAMRRVESNGKGHPGRDLFAFTIDWLHDHWDSMPDYVLGAPVFDLGLVAMIRRFHGLPALTMSNLAQDMPPADMPPGGALHESHKPEWAMPNAEARPSARRNKELFHQWAAKYAPEMQFTKNGNLK